MSDLSSIPEHIKNQPWSVRMGSDEYGDEWFNYENLEEAIAGLNRLVIAAMNPDLKLFGEIDLIDREYGICPTVQVPVEYED